MNIEIIKTISAFSVENISLHRQAILQPLVKYLQTKWNAHDDIRLNFICTHNSRRSHLSQIWAQTLAFHFEVKSVFCYSGGTEATAMFPKVAETLVNQGFYISKLSESKNPVYATKYAANEPPVLCFSKAYNHQLNPQSNFAAIMTCDSADDLCPMVLGAEARFPIKYVDPKIFDNTEYMNQKYADKSLEIGQELWYIFGQIKKG